MDYGKLMRLEYYLININNAVDKFNYKSALRKIRSLSQKRKLAQVTIIPVANAVNSILMKNLKQTF